MAATSLTRAIRQQTSLVPAIKWPNDVLVGGKKVAGILTELQGELDRIKFIILGMGVDVNVAPNEFPAEVRDLATSLRIETGASISRAELAVAILRELDDDYARICSGEFEALANEWEEQCSTIGQNVVIRVGDRQIRGLA